MKYAPTAWQTKIRVDADPDMGFILLCQGRRDRYRRQVDAYPAVPHLIAMGRVAAYQDLLTTLLGMPFLGTPATYNQVDELIAKRLFETANTIRFGGPAQ